MVRPSAVATATVPLVSVSVSASVWYSVGPTRKRDEPCAPERVTSEARSLAGPPTRPDYVRHRPGPLRKDYCKLALRVLDVRRAVVRAQIGYVAEPKNTAGIKRTRPASTWLRPVQCSDNPIAKVPSVFIPYVLTVEKLPVLVLRVRH